MLLAVDRDAQRAAIVTALHRFDAGDRTCAEECAHRRPVERWPETQLELEHVGNSGCRRATPLLAAQSPGSQSVALLEERVETPHAAETARERDLGDRQRRVGEETLREQQLLRLREFDRRYAELAAESAAQVPVGDAQARGDSVQSFLVQRPVFHHARGGLREARGRIHARVARCELGSAAQARPVAARLRGRRARKEAAVLALGRLDGADRAAINARRRDRYKKTAVEPGITRFERPVTDAGVENHERIMGAAAGLVWPFSDIAARRRARRSTLTHSKQSDHSTCTPVSLTMRP